MRLHRTAINGTWTLKCRRRRHAAAGNIVTNAVKRCSGPGPTGQKTKQHTSVLFRRAKSLAGLAHRATALVLQQMTLAQTD